MSWLGVLHAERRALDPRVVAARIDDGCQHLTGRDATTAHPPGRR